jgi:hypothetical protein
MRSVTRLVSLLRLAPRDLQRQRRREAPGGAGSRALGAHAGATAVAAVAPLAVMLADAGTPAVLTGVPLAVMLEDAGAPAVLAVAPLAVMLADAGAPAVIAGAPDAGRSCMDDDIEGLVCYDRKRLHVKLLSGWQKSIALPHHFQNEKAIVLLILRRLCSQMPAPPQSLHLLLMWLCWQIPAPRFPFPQSLHLLRMSLCSQMPEPLQSLHAPLSVVLTLLAPPRRCAHPLPESASALTIES